MMVENDLELGKKLFKLFPELERWLGHFILLEDIDKYVYYGFVDKEREKGIEIITCEITIFTITSIFSFTIRKPDELMQNGDIWCLMSGFDKYRDGLGTNDFGEGFYNERDFNDIMKRIMRAEGFDTSVLMSKNLVSLDLVNFDGLF
jgi:hypothetical protein